MSLNSSSPTWPHPPNTDPTGAVAPLPPMPLACCHKSHRPLPPVSSDLLTYAISFKANLDFRRALTHAFVRPDPFIFATTNRSREEIATNILHVADT